MVIYEREVKRLIIPIAGEKQDIAPCPGCELEEGNFRLLAGSESPWEFLPTSGYDGFSAVTVQDAGYGDEKFNQGFQSGQSSVVLEEANIGLSEFWTGPQTISINDLGVTANGWSSITVYDQGCLEYNYQRGFQDGLGQCSGICTNIQQQKYINVSGRPSAGEVFIYPDEGFDGVWEGIANIDGALDRERENAYEAIAEQAQDFVVTGYGSFSADTGNGVYYKTVEVPFIYSFEVIFHDHYNIDFSNVEISNITMAGAEFTPTETGIRTPQAVYAFGALANNIARFDYLTFDIPTSVYNTWTPGWTVNFVSFNGRHYYGPPYYYVGGITFAPYSASATVNGDTTTIMIRIYRSEQ